MIKQNSGKSKKQPDKITDIYDALARFERNKRLVADYRTGKWAVADLTKKYSISRQRVHQVLARARERGELPPLAKRKKKV